METSNDPIYLEHLTETECRSLLETARVGRVAWWDGVDVQVIPVNYQISQDQVVFVTSTAGVLAPMVEGMPVTFQVDDVDVDTATGWSVMARGTTGEPATHPDVDVWRPDATLPVGITLTSMTGRVISGPQAH